MAIQKYVAKGPTISLPVPAQFLLLLREKPSFLAITKIGLIPSHFSLANPENRFGRYPCKRYNTAVKMLSEIKSENDLTVDFLASILDRVHEEGKGLNTLFSNIFDLKKGLVYLYYWRQFDYVVTLDVAEVIAPQPQPARIKTLFPQEIVDQASSEYEKYQKRHKKIIIGAAVIAIVIWMFVLAKQSILNRAR